nr:SDR family oxidoreductase [Polycyclovorans algicola]
MKRVFISGGAAGIGRATAQQFINAGYAVGIGDVNELALRDTAKALGSACQPHVLDVCDPAAWTRALTRFTGDDGRLDVLINNAGILHAGRAEDITFEQHSRLVDINIKGVIAGCQAALPFLKNVRHSRVINLCSASAIYGQPSVASYSASKFFVRGWTEALNIEWARYDIHVLSVWPIFVKTAMVDNAPDMKAAAKMGVSLTPDDVAKILLKLSGQKRPAVHTPIGLQTSLFKRFVNLMPDALNRRVVAHMADIRA